MKVIIKSPIKAYVSAEDSDMDKLRRLLNYTNTSVQFLYKKHMKNQWWRNSNPDTWKERADELKAEMNATLLFHDADGYFVRPGSIPYIKESFEKVEIESRVTYPKPKLAPWSKKIPFELYPYQKESVEKLIEAGHGNVQLCTGAGKSAIILTICRNLGLRTVIAVPSASIFSEMLDKFTKHLGKAQVGGVGDGKRQFGKKFTVAISKSLTNLKPGTKEYNDIASADVLLVDESHLWGAGSLDEICHGIFEKVPYRFFFSGTQTRGDGSEKLLQSIIGPTVKELSTKEAIEGGFICDHEFRIVPIPSSSPGYAVDDPLKMKRKHLLHNENVAKFIAKLANSVYQAKGEQTLVLVDEIDQIYKLIPHLTIPFACATGESKKDLGESTDPQESVEKFNRGEAKILIGTSCISTGTNIFPVHHLVNWQGGSSEIKTKQGAVGRSVRKLEGSGYEQFHVPKKKAIVWDIDIIGVDVMRRHLQERIAYYRDSGTDIKVVGNERTEQKRDI